MPVEPNHIYLMPPRKEMIIRERHLLLTDKEPHTFSLPIDHFFRSLAQDVGPRAVAVVLSGSGSDGSRGIVDVKRAGGLVLAESPETARSSTACRCRRQRAASSISMLHARRDRARCRCARAILRARAGDGEPPLTDAAMDAMLRAAARPLRHRLLALQDDDGRRGASSAASSCCRSPDFADVRRAAAQRSATSSTRSTTIC